MSRDEAESTVSRLHFGQQREGHGQDPAQDGAQELVIERLVAPDGQTAGYRRLDAQRGAQPAEPASGDVSRTDVLFGNVPLRPAYAERHEGYGAASGEESPTRGLPYRLSPLHQAHRIAQERAENPYSDPLENAEDFQRIAELLSDALKGDA